MLPPLERARRIVHENRHVYRQVPPLSAGFSCRTCFGAITPGYQRCVSCSSLVNSCPDELLCDVIPMSVVPQPSQWYHALYNYKRAQWEEYKGLVAALPYVWLHQHRQRIESLLGGPVDVITIVPSTRPGVSYEKQKLRNLLLPFDALLEQTLECENVAEYSRSKYCPDLFRTVKNANVKRKRIVLVEDTWVTGGKAVSAAGLLMDAGARSVIITPIAREVRVAYEPAKPYLASIPEEYDVAVWPPLT